MKVHKLKIHEKYYDRIISEQKKFEIRENSRDFQAGDRLLLVVYDTINRKYTDVFAVCDVTYVFHGDEYGLESGYVVMSIDLLEYGFDMQVPTPESLEDRTY